MLNYQRVPDMEHMDNPAHLRNSSHEEPSSQTMSNRARQPLLAVDGKDEGGKPVKLKMKLMKSNIQMIYIYICSLVFQQSYVKGIPSFNNIEI